MAERRTSRAEDREVGNAVLLEIYEHCLDGDDDAATQGIEDQPG